MMWAAVVVFATAIAADGAPPAPEPVPPPTSAAPASETPTTAPPTAPECPEEESETPSPAAHHPAAAEDDDDDDEIPRGLHEHPGHGRPIDADCRPHSPYTQSRRAVAVEAEFGLAGDLWGFRRSLAELGIDFAAEVTLDAIWNTRGGSATGTALASLIDVDLGVRTGPLLGWKGGRFYIGMLAYGQAHDPYALVDNYWGWDSAVSGIGTFTQIAELWYEQEFFDRLLTLRFGKQDVNSTFAIVPGAGAFISSAATYPGTVLGYLPTYPRQATGLDLVVRPVDWLTGRFGWFDGTSNYYDADRGTLWPNTGTRGPKSFFGNPGSWFLITELDARWSLGEVPLPGSAQIGYWWQTGPVAFETGLGPDPAVPYVTDGSEGLYLGASQTLFNLSQDERATRHVTFFSQLGFGDGASNPVTFSLISGLSATGVIPGRDRDQIGVQFNYLNFSNDARVWVNPGTDQLGVEVFYRVQVTPALAIQPDLQWIRRPGGDPDERDALLLTLRMQFAF